MISGLILLSSFLFANDLNYWKKQMSEFEFVIKQEGKCEKPEFVKMMQDFQKCLGTKEWKDIVRKLPMNYPILKTVKNPEQFVESPEYDKYAYILETYSKLLPKLTNFNVELDKWYESMKKLSEDKEIKQTETQDIIHKFKNYLLTKNGKQIEYKGTHPLLCGKGLSEERLNEIYAQHHKCKFIMETYQTHQ